MNNQMFPIGMRMKKVTAPKRALPHGSVLFWGIGNCSYGSQRERAGVLFFWNVSVFSFFAWEILQARQEVCYTVDY